MPPMTKAEAIALFGSPKELGEALGISRHAIYQWPDDLEQHHVDRVTGAAMRLGKLPSSAEPSESSDREAAA